MIDFLFMFLLRLEKTEHSLKVGDKVEVEIKGKMLIIKKANPRLCFPSLLNSNRHIERLE